MKIKNNIKNKIIILRATKEIESGEKVTLKEVFLEISNYVGCTYENIAQLYKGNNGGSLYLALKLSEFFNCKVEDLFYLDNE